MSYTVWIAGRLVSGENLDNLEEAFMIRNILISRGHNDVYIMWQSKEKQRANA